jgi:hypothetical protein
MSQQVKYEIINKNDNLIISFGGMRNGFGPIPPFEFLNYLSTNYTNRCDLVFFIDIYQCWYHKGLKDFTNNIDETVIYINNIIQKRNYKKVIFIGTSSGGYAAILFGSLCNGVTNVISYVPQTILINPIENKYSNLSNFINKNVKYILYGDISEKVDHYHNISHCKNLENFKNVKIIEIHTIMLKELRDNGTIKNIIDKTLISD